MSPQEHPKPPEKWNTSATGPQHVPSPPSPSSVQEALHGVLERPSPRGTEALVCVQQHRRVGGQFLTYLFELSPLASHGQPLLPHPREKERETVGKGSGPWHSGPRPRRKGKGVFAS